MLQRGRWTYQLSLFAIGSTGALLSWLFSIRSNEQCQRDGYDHGDPRLLNDATVIFIFTVGARSKGK